MNKDKIMKMVVILACIVVIAGSLSRMIGRDSLTLTEYESQNAQNGSTGEKKDGTPSGEGNSPGKSEDNISSDEDNSSAENESSSPSNEDNSPDESKDNVPSNEDNSPDGSKDSVPSNEDNSSGENEGSTPSSREPAGNETPLLTGAALNGTSQLEERVSITDDFYYEPVSDRLQRYMTGISYPETAGAGRNDESTEDSDTQNGNNAEGSSGTQNGNDAEGSSGTQNGNDAEGSSGTQNENNTDDSSGGGEKIVPEIGFDELRYVHILHYDFEGNSVPGELICNEYIAQDLTEIFYELYRNEYRLERVLLIDEYDGDDELSMEDNNTSCFNYRPVTNAASLSMHAYGLAVDINPLYNPYIAFSKDGSQEVLPASALAYTDRSQSFPYKIDEEDLCYKLFTQHGFIWGGNWNNVKDYQHFQKSRPQ